MACQPVEVLIPGSPRSRGALMCNTTDWLFGPLFDSIDDALAFCVWLERDHDSDPRRHTDDQLIQLKAEWEAKRKG